jgi:5-methylcytosine-specific restriction endonuclease McrA
MAKGIGSYIKKKDILRIKSIDHCLYCGSKLNLMIDHIIPPSKGGNSELSNLTRSCNSCNSSKSDKTLHEFYKHIFKKRSIALAEYLYYDNIIKSLSQNAYKIKSDE